MKGEDEGETGGQSGKRLEVGRRGAQRKTS